MMKPHKISLIHAIALVALGSFGAMSSESMTAWIPTVFGVLLLACNRGVKNENKVLAHVAVLLTLLIVIGLVKPLQGALGREDMGAAARVATMLGLSVVALATFVKSFMDARKKKG
ncbi:hypothetical protein N9D95_00510 [Flavobacteriales bacterium]|nr:hypothetical protein [Flavobacteriales bacterium]